MELDENNLDNIMAGNTQQGSEEQALAHEDLFREKQIERLKQAREQLKEEQKQNKSEVQPTNGEEQIAEETTTKKM